MNSSVASSSFVPPPHQEDRHTQPGPWFPQEDGCGRSDASDSSEHYSYCT